ncbi:hypothetical protein A5844_000014 [Enterococcus sp. 10A9_DIV0425]|uniref:Uncharacterized protein n=1 Tax=Candidatus Enterococcus wittei TaxID=1987383 RepID=A0A2C9XNP6_9ENTE|nr:hypothetical protein [Enterococcus sp. 10A9_DIV0425]OTP11800.1 hypothetical protein A5844_000014 [Enterococcus sp. 10A9_DIV0425]
MKKKVFILVEEIKKQVIEKYEEILEKFDLDPKKYFRRAGYYLLCSILVTIGMFYFPGKIREAQVSSIVYSSIHSEKLQPIPIDSANSFIKEQKAISVLFSLPKGEAYEKVMALFDDPVKINELNRPIFFYPLIYDVQELEDTYGIKKDEVTIIFFDGGKEKNRMTVTNESDKTLRKTFIPELNRLPLTKIKQLEQEMETKTTQSKD